MKIISCSCVSDKHGNRNGVQHQEALLGAGKRYGNERPSGGHTCTVCGSKSGGK